MDNKYIHFCESNADKQPYSDLVVVDDKFLIFSGLISQDLETGEYIKGSITEETKRILDNLELLLQQYGSDMDHVIQTQVLLADFSERDEMNVEYMKHFKKTRKPARLCFGNTKLACNCKIEVMAVALKK